MVSWRSGGWRVPGLSPGLVVLSSHWLLAFVWRLGYWWLAADGWVVHIESLPGSFTRVRNVLVFAFPKSWSCHWASSVVAVSFLGDRAGFVYQLMLVFAVLFEFAIWVARFSLGSATSHGFIGSWFFQCCTGLKESGVFSHFFIFSPLSSSSSLSLFLLIFR